MADHKNHTHSHHCAHGPVSDVPFDEEKMDPAQQQLAKALQSSFRLLSVIMVFVVIFFLLTGLSAIDSSEVGVISRFGEIVDVARPGLTYAWPFPVGGITKISTAEQHMQIRDFWLFETPAEAGTPLDQRNPQGEGGLRPGYDGALLTGDNILCHVLLDCTYAIRSEQDPTRDSDHPAKLYVMNVDDPKDPDRKRTKELIRSLVVTSAIRAAAVRTGDALRTGQSAFSREVADDVQKSLDAIESGIAFKIITIKRFSWPLSVRRDYIEAQNALAGMEKERSAARGEANSILNGVAGRNYVKLVGDVAGVLRSATGKNADVKGQDYDLIGQYIKAWHANDKAKSDKLLVRINEVLTDSETTGRAGTIIAIARSESSQFTESVKSRAKAFAELLPKFEENPNLMLADRWGEVLQEILSSPTVELVLLSEGDRKIVLKTRRDRQISKRIDRERARKKESDNTGK